MKARVLGIIVGAALLATGCYDDSAIMGRMDELEQEVTSIKEDLATINTNISALQAIVEAAQKNLSVTGITEVKDQADGSVIGYTILFSDSSIVTIYHGKKGDKGDKGEDGTAGKNGNVPQIGVQMVNGVYCWTVDGVLLKDADDKVIPATGTAGNDGLTPQLRINEGYWEVSYDGEKWEVLGSATGSVTAVDAVFSDVRETSEGVVFVLTDGNEILIPRDKPFGLVFGKVSGLEVASLTTTEIPYTVNNSTEETVVDAFASGNWIAEIVAENSGKGVLKVTAPEDGKDGKVLAYATDGTGKSDIKTLSFTNGILEVVAGTKEVSAEGGTVTVSVTSNIDYTVSIPEDVTWISQAEVKSGETVTNTLTFSIAANNTPERRTGIISILDPQGTAVQKISIVQEAGAAVPVMITDENFEKYIIKNFDTDGNGKISVTEAAAVESITYSEGTDGAVTSFDGVSAFYNLKTFKFDGNSSSTISSIDLSGNSKLKVISVRYASSITEVNVEGLAEVLEINIAQTSVTAIDISDMKKLTSFYAPNSSLAAVDFTNNTALKEISIYGTKVTTLDVSPCKSLNSLYAGIKTLTSLNLSGNTELTYLSMDDSGVSEVDFSSLINLVEFTAKESNLKNADLSKSPLLTTFYCRNADYLEVIDVSAATKLSTFSVQSCFAVKTIRFSKAVESNVSSFTYPTENWVGDDHVIVNIEFVGDSAGETSDYSAGIQDQYARAKILREYDLDNDGQISATEAASVTEIDLSGYFLTDASGLEVFPLETLILANNNLTSFDATDMKKLKKLDLRNNRLTSVTGLKKAEDMEYLDLSGNSLTGNFSYSNLPFYFLSYLNMSGNTGATVDPYNMSSLTEVDLSNTATANLAETAIARTVVKLNLSGTQLSGSVKFSTAEKLETLNISNTAITSIDITKAATTGSIKSIDATDTPLEVIIVGSGNSLPDGIVTGASNYTLINVASPTISRLKSNEFGNIKTFNAGTGATEQEFNINRQATSTGFVINAGGEASITVKENGKVLKFYAIGVGGTPTVELVRSSGRSILTKSTDSSYYGEDYKSTDENPFTALKNDAASADGVTLLIDGDRDYRFYNFGEAYDDTAKTTEDETITFRVTGNAGEKVIIFGINISTSRDDEE